jgi:hypothetical protein
MYDKGYVTHIWHSMLLLPMDLLLLPSETAKVRSRWGKDPASQKTALRKLSEGMLRSYCPRNRGICFIVAASELDLT